MDRPVISRFGLALLASCAALSLLLNLGFILENYHNSRVVALAEDDSIVLADGRRVQLYGADVPVPGACMSAEAREQLSSLVLRRHVRLKHVSIGEDAGVQAIVIVEDFPTWISYLRSRAFGLPLNPDPLVNRAMLGDGLAEYTAHAPAEYEATLRAAQESARQQGLGIHSDACKMGD